MGYLLFWILIGAGIGYAIGKSKGRPMAGAVWGALLGVIGWIVILIGPDYGRKCPECRGRIPDDARRCLHCGYQIVSGGVSQDSDMARASANRAKTDATLAMARNEPVFKMKCPGCGKSFWNAESEGWIDCPGCGCPVDAAAAVEA